MPEQLALFSDAGRSHSGDPWTSAAAAVSIRRGSQRWRVLAELRQAGDEGRTDSELGDRLAIRETAAGTRRKELEELGFVERTTRSRLTRYGNPALVHVITRAGALLVDELDHPSGRENSTGTAGEHDQNRIGSVVE